MAKVSKSLLKEIVKECIVEILSEGLSSSLTEAKSLNTNIQQIKEEKKYSRHVENILPKNKSFESKSKQLISQTTSDPVLQDILADTANTTLQEQINADGKPGYIKPRNKEAEIVENSDPMDLFGDASNNWASLAFSDSSNN